MEDTVSGLGIFKSFRGKYKELCGKDIPFYMNDGFLTGFFSDGDEDECDTEYRSECEYGEDTINFQDILFLIWYLVWVNCLDAGLVFPQNLKILLMAYKIFDLLCAAYENAPSNAEYGKVFSRIPIHADPAYLRAFCFQFASGNYLYGPDILQRFESYKNNTKDDAVSSDMPNHTYEYLNKAVFSLKSRSRLLTLDIFEITDRIARYHPFYQPDRFRIDSNSFIFSVFKVLAVNEDWVKLEHVGTGCIIDVVASSFPDMTNIKLHHQIACGVLKKDTYWYFCSIMIALQRDIDTFTVDSEQATAYKCRMDEQAAQLLQSILQSMYKTFIELYGKNMLFLPRQEAEKVTGAFFAVHNAKLKAEKDCGALQEQDLPNPVFEDIHISDAENVTVYFNPKSGFELYSNIADTMEVEGNPFFAAFSEDVVFKLIYDSDFSTEFCHEIISLLLQKDTLKDSTQYKGLTFDDFDFFKRFCNPDSYKSPPHIFLV